MTLLNKVEKVLVEIGKENSKRSEALRRAEELSDKYSYVKPKNEVPTAEKYFGLPSYFK